jgi:hypothetical protein
MTTPPPPPGTSPSAALPLVARFLLDAQSEFVRAIDHIPAPGRGGPLGRLNAAGWVIAHLAWSHDLWVNVLVAGRAPDPWAARWFQQQDAATLARPFAPPFAEARDAALAIFGRAAEVAEAMDAAALTRAVQTPRGEVAAGYLIARAPAHLLAHAGELAVLGALVTAEELDLPGVLPRTTWAAVDPAAEAAANPALPPLVVRLLLDAQHEFGRAVDALPQPAAAGAVARVHPGALTIAEVANHQAETWSTEQRIWSGAAITGRASREHVPTYDDARAAYLAAIEGSAPVLEALRADDLARPMGDTTVGAEVVRSAGLLFARAGELNALASLFGAPDLAQPGPLARTLER